MAKKASTDEKIENAKIASTFLGIEDHGILTFFVHVEGAGWGQGVGGYALDGRQRRTESRIGYGPGLLAMRKILETVGVEKWEDLPGTLIRVKRIVWGSSTPPVIGHIIEDKWFDLKAFMAEMEKSQGG